MNRTAINAPVVEAGEPNRFRVFTEGDELYEDMIRSILTARHSIALESYIFDPDAIGSRFVAALIRSAAAGVRVQLHLDAFGSMALALSDLPDRLRTTGVELKWFNPLRWYKPLHFNRRNHRKLLIVDDRSVWLGGFNIHEENSQHYRGQQRWHDTHIRIDGPVAAQARVYFDRLWQGRRDWSPAWVRGADTLLVSNHNWLQRHQLRRMLAMQFHRARRQIWMCTPYFMPDHFLQRQMIKAARRGLDVRLLLPYESDRPVTQLVARAAYSSLMAAGIRIYEYEPRFLHAKIIVVDDDWCTLGSANLDYRSFFVNYEINLVSTRVELVRQLRDNLDADMALSMHIIADERSGWRGRILRLFGGLLRRVL